MAKIRKRKHRKRKKIYLFCNKAKLVITGNQLFIDIFKNNFWLLFATFEKRSAYNLQVLNLTIGLTRFEGSIKNLLN